MATTVNKIRNPDFTKGKTDPSGWVWKATGRGTRWQRSHDEGPNAVAPAAKPCPSPMTLVSDRTDGSACWSQVVVCQPGKFYRVEAAVTCDLTAAEQGGGMVLSVIPEPRDSAPAMSQVAETPSGHREFAQAQACGSGRRVTPGLRRASQPIDIRTYYQIPDGVRRLKVSVGVEAAAGTASIHHVRFILLLEPDEESHLLAIPEPALALPPPRAVEQVCVCSREAADRPITRRLAACLGEQHVHAIKPAELRSSHVRADALLLPDSTPPTVVRSLRALFKLATERIVVISLPAFAKLADGALRLRRIEQEDDPIHAAVVCANYATRGFALNDTFAFAWPGSAMGSFVQRHFRKTPEFREFCKLHGFETLLESMCDQDSTSDQPVCLHKATTSGGLFVLDMEPAEARGSTMGEPTLAMHLLLAMLGQVQPGLGQYVSPVREQPELRLLIREMAIRFESLVVCDDDVPADEVTRQLVTVGREDADFGLPLAPKPVILIRSGLTGGDVESVCSGLLWFKQLLRAQPHVCPYTRPLADQYRLAWVPCAAGWEPRDGWRRSGCPPREPMLIETEGAALAAVIDLVSCPTNRARVVVPTERGLAPRLLTWLPKLMATFVPGRHFVFGVADGGAFDDRDGFAWRRAQPDVQVVVDPEAFRDDSYRDVLSTAEQVVRIELPGSDADFVAHSIQRTDLATTLLEQVIGLQYGLIAVNRQASAAHLDGFAPVAPGEALIIDRRDPMLQTAAAQAG